MRGRKPRSIEQRIREGNPGKRPLPDVLIVGGRPIPSELAEPPEHLPEDGKEFWREVVPQLASIGMIDRVDVVSLELMATMFARIRQARRVIAEDGHFSLGAAGQIKEHPALKIERESIVVFSRLAESFGLNPTARARLGLAHLQGRALSAEITDLLGEPQLTPVGHG